MYGKQFRSKNSPTILNSRLLFHIQRAGIEYMIRVVFLIPASESKNRVGIHDDILLHTERHSHEYGIPCNLDDDEFGALYMC